MRRSLNRRLFLASGAAVSGAALTRAAGAPLVGESKSDTGPAIYPEFPSQDPRLVLETVAVSHGNFQRVRELVEARPALAKATWDWGFGDWESALGAASHTGNRDIALFLIEHGARPTIFSAAMLGQLAVVKAFVEASPGVQGTPGPHGITLLAHARFGREAAKDVLEYLEAVGGADPVPRSLPLSDSEKAIYLGSYVFGSGPEDRLEVVDVRGSLMVRRGEKGTPRGMVHLGNHVFHPAGASAVRLVFAVEGERAKTLTVLDPDPMVTSKRAD